MMQWWSLERLMRLSFPKSENSSSSKDIRWMRKFGQRACSWAKCIVVARQHTQQNWQRTTPFPRMDPPETSQFVGGAFVNTLYREKAIRLEVRISSAPHEESEAIGRGAATGHTATAPSKVVLTFLTLLCS